MMRGYHFIYKWAFSYSANAISGPAAVAVTCCTSGDLRTLYMWVQTVDGPKLESYELGFLATDQTEVFVYGIAKSFFKPGFAID